MWSQKPRGGHGRSNSRLASDYGSTRRALRAAEERAREPWPQRQEAAKRRVRAAEGEVEAFIRVRLPDLTGELGSQERKLRARIQAGLEDIESAITDLAQLDTHRNQLVYTATGTQDTNRVGGLAELHREVKRALRGGVASARGDDPVIRTAA